MSEKARLEILQRQQFLRFQGDIRLKKITDTLIRHFQCPIALISLVESANVRFLAISGLEITDIDRNLCFCNHNVLPDSNRFLRIEDARKDARFQENPLVMGEESLRFYAGIPMMFEGIKIGSVAIIDINPRYDFDSSCLDELRSFHDEVIKILLKGEVMNHQNMDLMNVKEGSLHQLIGNILQTIQYPMESLAQKENRLQELKRSLKQSNSSTNLLNPFLALVGLQKSPKIHDQEEEGDAAVVTVAQQINQLQKEMIETKSMIKNHLQYAVESIHRLKQFTDISTKASSTKDEIKENAILDPPSDANQSPIYTCTKDWLEYIYSQIRLRYLSSQIKERSKHHRSRIAWNCVQTKEMKLREISNALQESISMILQFALLLLFPIYEHVSVQVSTIERQSDRQSVNGPEEVDIAFTITPKRKRACKTPQSSIGSDIIAVGYNILATSLLTLPNAHFERRGRNDMLLFRFTCDWRVACGQKTFLHCVDSEQEEKERKEKKMNGKEVFSVTTPTNSISSTHNNSHTLQRKTKSSNKAGEKYQKEEVDDNEDRSSSLDVPIAYIEEETHLYSSAPISSSSFSLLSFFRFNQVLPAK